MDLAGNGKGTLDTTELEWDEDTGLWTAVKGFWHPPQIAKVLQRRYRDHRDGDGPGCSGTHPSWAALQQLLCSKRGKETTTLKLPLWQRHRCPL